MVLKHFWVPVEEVPDDLVLAEFFFTNDQFIWNIDVGLLHTDVSFRRNSYQLTFGPESSRIEDGVSFSTTFVEPLVEFNVFLFGLKFVSGFPVDFRKVVTFKAILELSE